MYTRTSSRSFCSKLRRLRSAHPIQEAFEIILGSISDDRCRMTDDRA